MSFFSDQLKQLRIKKQLSQAALAEQSKVDRSMISRMEKGLVEPTIGVAQRIARALDVSLLQMLEAAGQPRLVHLTVNEQPVSRTADARRETRVLFPTPAYGTVEWLHTTLAPSTSSGTLPAYGVGTEGYLLLLAGQLAARINGQQRNLKEGDSLFFDAYYPHEFVSGSEPAEYILAIKK